MNTIDHDVSPTTSTFYIISKIWVWIAVVFITFVVCLSVFPSILALVDSTEKGNVSNAIFVLRVYLDNLVALKLGMKLVS
jgi:hypothetical protein